MWKSSEHLTVNFYTSVFRKPIHTNRYMNFESNHPICHKRSVAMSLVNCAKLLPSDEISKQQELQCVFGALRMNGYPGRFVREWMMSQSVIEPSNNHCIIIPYVRGVSERISKILKVFNVKVFYKAFCKLTSFFQIPKDSVPFDMIRGVVYHLNCLDCASLYVGQTKKSMNSFGQHKAACRLTQAEKSAWAEHSIRSDHRIDWQHPNILARQPSWRKRLLWESWWTDRRYDVTIDRCEVMIPAVYRLLPFPFISSSLTSLPPFIFLRQPEDASSSARENSYSIFYFILFFSEVHSVQLLFS